jgi:hypothetical protein
MVVTSRHPSAPPAGLPRAHRTDDRPRRSRHRAPRRGAWERREPCPRQLRGGRGCFRCTGSFESCPSAAPRQSSRPLCHGRTRHRPRRSGAERRCRTRCTPSRTGRPDRGSSWPDRRLRAPKCLPPCTAAEGMRYTSKGCAALCSSELQSTFRSAWLLETSPAADGFRGRREKGSGGFSSGRSRENPPDPFCRLERTLPGHYDLFQLAADHDGSSRQDPRASSMAAFKPNVGEEENRCRCISPDSATRPRPGRG